MAQDKKALHLGGARVRVAGRYVGQVMDAALERSVTKAEHMTNVDLEFRRDFILPIETRFGLRFTFGEVIPYNANLLMGMPGYRAVPLDRQLSGNVLAPFQFTNDPRIYTEYPTLGLSVENRPIWSPLVYPMGSSASSAMLPVGAVAAKNNSPANPGSMGFVGFFVTACEAAGTKESILSSVALVEHNTAAAGNGDTITLTVTLDPSYIALNTLRVYRFAYSYYSAYGTYQGTAAANALYEYSSGPAVDDYVIQPGDVTAGYATLTVTAKKALVSGNPPLPLSAVTSYDGSETFVWLDDFDIMPLWKGGSAIRRTLSSVEQAGASGAIEAFETVKCIYYYNGAGVAELPLGTSRGENPVVPMSLEIPMPDGQSKIYIELHRVQVNQSFTFALNERDWTGVPFTGDALDAEELFPDYPYGFWQVMGPLAERIKQGGNYAAFGNLADAFQTPWKTLYT